LDKTDKNQQGVNESKASANNLHSQEAAGLTAIQPPDLFASALATQLKEDSENQNSENIATSDSILTSSTNDNDISHPIKALGQLKEEGQEESEVDEIQMKSFADAPSELPNDEDAGSSGGDPPSDLSENTKNENALSSSSFTTQKKDGHSENSSKQSNSDISNDVMGKMETTIGHDFSNVNIHTNSSSAKEKIENQASSFRSVPIQRKLDLAQLDENDDEEVRELPDMAIINRGNTNISETAQTYDITRSYREISGQLEEASI
jgi:hypothetical protein